MPAGARTPRRFIIALVLGVAATLPACASAPVLTAAGDGNHVGRTYYVSPSGSDRNSGTSTSSPWKTIGRVNRARLHAGDTVLFQGGASFTGESLRGNGGGERGKPLTYSTYGVGNAIVPAIYIEKHDFLTYNHFTIHGTGITSYWGAGGTQSSDITIENSLITDVKAGIGVISGDRWRVLNNTIAETGDSGILTQTGDEGGRGIPGNEWVIDNNLITKTGLHDFGWDEHGIYLKCTNSEVSNNTITAFQDSGISQRYGNDTITKNRVSNGHAGSIGIEFIPYDSTGRTSHWVENNVSGTVTGLYAPLHDSGSPPPGGTTRENFVVERNAIGPLMEHGNGWIDMHSEGTIKFVQNSLLR
jgi:Periplasmic copper-binding protein (NosD)